MAKTHKRPQLVPKNSSGSAEEPPPPDNPPQEAAPDPVAGRKKSRTQAEPSFWDKVNAVPPSEWTDDGKYYIYLYLLEPTNNLKIDGEPGYLMKYFKPIDAQHIMERFGSGRYHLKFKKKRDTSGRNDTLIGDTTFEIFNPAYPPKTPVSIWKKDSKNERWLALMPPDKPATPEQPANDPAKMFEVFEKMADRVEARYARDEPEPPPDPADQFKTVVSTAKDMFAMANPPREQKEDGFQKFLLTELSEERKANRELMQEMLKAKTAASTTPPADPMAMFDQIMDRADKIRERVAPEGEAVRNSRMNGWQEFGLEIARAVFQSPAVANLSQGFLVWAMTKNQNGQNGHAPQPQQQAPNPNGLPAPAIQPQTQQPGGQPVKLSAQQFAQMIIPEFISPVMLHLTDREKNGYDLADIVIGSKGEDAYEFARQHGPDLIMDAFKLTPFWSRQPNGTPGLSSMEPQLRELITEFCSDPPPDEENQDGSKPQPAATTAAPINLMDDAEQQMPGE